MNTAVGNGPPPTPDTTLPTITDISATDVNSNRAVITWQTDENATSVAEYGLTQSYGSQTKETNLITSHNLVLTGLTPESTYQYRVRSTDSAGNEQVSNNFNFTTNAFTPTNGNSLSFTVNNPGDNDHGFQPSIPGDFGAEEFTMELWVKADNSFPVGPTSGVSRQLNWSIADNTPGGSQWWYDGNFLLDGHNNVGGSGTFSLQFYGGGRLRWHFDGSSASRVVQAFPANTTPSLLDGTWHHVTLVRRWINTDDAQLEMWIDGSLIDTKVIGGRTNMRQYWDTFSDYHPQGRGWFWGAEKQVTYSGSESLYDDYKGLFDEVSFWNRAKPAAEIQAN